MPIYTKKGDKGETGTLEGKRISKDSLQIEILGTIDEANSFLGLSTSFLEEQYLKNKIEQVQRTLFKLGSIIAGAKGSISKSVVTKYEKEIDEWTNIMPKLNNFIFPGGCSAAASLYISRTVVRRLERVIIHAKNSELKISDSTLIFINRLSDYLFTLARYINFREGIKEKINK